MGRKTAIGLNIEIIEVVTIDRDKSIFFGLLGKILMGVNRGALGD